MKEKIWRENIRTQNRERKTYTIPELKRKNKIKRVEKKPTLIFYKIRV